MTRVVALHAHPDDEVILTGGVIAALVRSGVAVTIVVATDGVVHDLPEGGSPRLADLHRSAAVLGVDDVRWLGYADSGAGPVLYPDPDGRVRFVRAPVEESVGRLVDLLVEVEADLLIGYDAAGGYHHPDHLRVHEVATAAAERANVPCLEATYPREPITRLMQVAGWLRISLPYRRSELGDAGTPRSQITHVADVRGQVGTKRRALAAHHTVVQGSGRSARLIRVVLRAPTRLVAPLLGREWYRLARGDLPTAVAALLRTTGAGDPVAVHPDQPAGSTSGPPVIDLTDATDDADGAPVSPGRRSTGGEPVHVADDPASRVIRR